MPLELNDTMKSYILHWGEMGTRWGINRSVAQVHALLYISPDPLPADVICETLNLARSNVSNCLKELQGWRIIKISHVFGDRRDHFESLKDVWVMFRIIMEERKKREMDPTVVLLKDCIAQAEANDDTYCVERLGAQLEFFETMGTCFEQTKRLPTSAFVGMVKLGDRISDLLSPG